MVRPALPPSSRSRWAIQASRAESEYMVNAFTFLLSGVIMVVSPRMLDISGSDVLDLLCFYPVSLAARAITIPFAVFVLREVLRKDCAPFDSSVRVSLSWCRPAKERDDSAFV